MKKHLYLLLLIPFFLTGCFGALSGDLVTTCVKEEYSASISESKTYTLYFKKGNIYKIVYDDTFTTTDNIDMSNAIKSYKRAYENETGISISTKENSISYEFTMEEVSDNVKKEFNLTKGYNEQVKKLKESGFVCK